MGDNAAVIGRPAAIPPASRGPAAGGVRRREPVATFSVEQMRRGVNITVGGGEPAGLPGGAASGGPALPGGDPLTSLPAYPSAPAEDAPGVLSIPGARAPDEALVSPEDRPGPGGPNLRRLAPGRAASPNPPAADPGGPTQGPREAPVSANGPAGEAAPDFGPGSFGRRYRPLDNGKMADARLKSSELDEAARLSKLSQIRKSAEEYEGLLIAEMIKSMRQSPFAKTPGSDTYSEIAEKPFTAALTAAGGLGLAQTIVTQVAAQEGLGETLAAHPEAMGPHYRQRLAPSQMTKPGGRPPASSESGQTEPPSGVVGAADPPGLPD